MLELKYYLIKIFTLLKEAKPRDIRLWVLDSNVTLESFEDYIIKSFDSGDKKKSYINFPGIFLDIYEDKMIGDLDELIKLNIIIQACI